MSAVIARVEYATTSRRVTSRTPLTCGIASTILYMLLAAVFWTDAAFNRTWAVEIFQYGILGLLTVLYFVGLSGVRHLTPRSIVAFGLIFAILGFMTAPFDSTDVFFYIAQGWLQTHYGGNPYANVLRDIPNVAGDPMIQSRWMELNHNPWLDEPIPYGFAFALLARFIAWLGQGHLWATLTLFAIINLGVHCAVSVLLWKSAMVIPEARPKLILYLYAWNPLILTQYLANRHNDIIMGALILFAFYCLCRRRPVWVLATLTVCRVCEICRICAFALRVDSSISAVWFEGSYEKCRCRSNRNGRVNSALHLGHTVLQISRGRISIVGKSWFDARLYDVPISCGVFHLVSYRSRGFGTGEQDLPPSTLAGCDRFRRQGASPVLEEKFRESSGSRDSLDFSIVRRPLYRKLAVLFVVHRNDLSSFIAVCWSESGLGYPGLALGNAHGRI
jgi:hypothetical protein